MLPADSTTAKTKPVQAWGDPDAWDPDAGMVDLGEIPGAYGDDTHAYLVAEFDDDGGARPSLHLPRIIDDGDAIDALRYAIDVYEKTLTECVPCPALSTDDEDSFELGSWELLSGGQVRFTEITSEPLNAYDVRALITSLTDLADRLEAQTEGAVTA